MRRHRFDPIEVLRSHQTALQERVQDAADPEEKQFLEKRLRNLDEVIQFLTSTGGAIDGAGADRKLDGALAAAKRAPITSSLLGKEPNQQHWRLPVGTSCSNV